jgi:hypothetical protein
MPVKIVFVPMRVDTDRMREISRMGTRALHEKYDGRALTANARAAFNQKFLDLVDPERILPEAERHARVAEARRSYFAQIGRRGAAAQRARRAGQAVTDAA